MYEPVIGHLKANYRLGRNFYKGIVGDTTNILLAAAAYNFKRIMNKWKASFWQFLKSIIYHLKNSLILLVEFLNNKLNRKMAF
jgi:IS5 family transposase